MTEKSIEQAIRKYLKSIGAKVIKVHGSGFGHAGTPDLIGAYAGRPLALEVKQPGKPLTPLQARELTTWAQAGAIAGRVENVEQVKELLELK